MAFLSLGIRSLGFRIYGFSFWVVGFDNSSDLFLKRDVWY